jgi:hypothetical protein
MFTTKGHILFQPNNVTKKHIKQSEWKKTAIILINDGLCDYYSWFIEKRYNIKLNKPLRGSHVTFINEIIDNNIFNDGKKFFDGKEIEINYDPTYIRTNDIGHWWIKVYSKDIESIRHSLGMNPNPYYGLHITIGNATHLQLEQSLYIKRLIDKKLSY